MTSEGTTPDHTAPGPPSTPPPVAMRSADSVRAILLTRRRSAPARAETLQSEVITSADGLKQELAATKMLLERAEIDKTQLETRILELVDDKAQLHVRLSAALADIKALESELSTASLKDYRARLERETDTGGKHAGADLAALRRENAKLKAFLKKLKGQSAGREQCSRERVVAAEAKSKQLATEVESLKRRLRFLEGTSREVTRPQGKKTHQRTTGGTTAARAPTSRRQAPPSPGREAEIGTTPLPSQPTRGVSNACASLKPVWK